jgi:hypothetical protein
MFQIVVPKFTKKSLNILAMACGLVVLVLLIVNSEGLNFVTAGQAVNSFL